MISLSMFTYKRDIEGKKNQFSSSYCARKLQRKGKLKSEKKFNKSSVFECKFTTFHVLFLYIHIHTSVDTKIIEEFFFFFKKLLVNITNSFKKILAN